MKAANKYTPVGKRIARFGPQYKLARILGVSQQTVSKKLRGKCAIMLSDLEKLARAFDTPIGVFFDSKEQVCEWQCRRGHLVWIPYRHVLRLVGGPRCPKCNGEMELVE